MLRRSWRLSTLGLGQQQRHEIGGRPERLRSLIEGFGARLEMRHRVFVHIEPSCEPRSPDHKRCGARRMFR